MIDITIHPAKKEVRFVNQSRIYNAIMNTVKKSFSRQLERSLVGNSGVFIDAVDTEATFTAPGDYEQYGYCV